MEYSFEYEYEYEFNMNGNEMKMNEKETKMFGKKRKRRFQINIFIEQIYLFCFQMSLQKRTFSIFFYISLSVLVGSQLESNTKFFIEK